MGGRRDASLLEASKGLDEIDLELLVLLSDGQRVRVSRDRVHNYDALIDAGLVALDDDGECGVLEIHRDGFRLLDLVGKATA